MATGQTLITRSLRLLGNMAPSTTELTDGLEALNAMLGAWRLERLMVYAITQISITATGAQSYTIASTGADVTAERPVKIEQAWYNDGSTDYEIEVLRLRGEYEAIPDKSSAGQPLKAYYLPAYPIATLYLWPKPSSGTVKLDVWTALDDTVALADTISLPPGYEDAIAFNLAVREAPEYGIAAPQLVMAMANETKAAIKRANLAIPLLDLPCDMPGMGRRTVNIITGY